MRVKWLSMVDSVIKLKLLKVPWWFVPCETCCWNIILTTLLPFALCRTMQCLRDIKQWKVRILTIFSKSKQGSLQWWWSIHIIDLYGNSLRYWKQTCSERSRSVDWFVLTCREMRCTTSWEDDYSMWDDACGNKNRQSDTLVCVYVVSQERMIEWMIEYKGKPRYDS